jgi:hypothetical protein
MLVYDYPKALLSVFSCYDFTPLNKQQRNTKAAFHTGQFRDTGNIGLKAKNEHKQKKNHYKEKKKI